MILFKLHLHQHQNIMEWFDDDDPLDYDYIVDPDEPMRPSLPAEETNDACVMQFIKVCVNGDDETLMSMFDSASRFRPSEIAFQWALYGATWMGNVRCVRVLVENNVDNFADDESKALAGMHLISGYGLDHSMPRSPEDPVLQFIPPKKQWPLPFMSVQDAKELVSLLRNDLPALMKWIKNTGEVDEDD
jgi:hypothetical protein